MSEAVARLTDSIIGMTSGEHMGHIPAHGPLQITGNISSNVSENVFVNGLAVATVGSVTTEYDGCCGSNSGKIANRSATVFVNGKPIARDTDKIDPHNGTAIVNSGSPNVFSS